MTVTEYNTLRKEYTTDKAKNVDILMKLTQWYINNTCSKTDVDNDDFVALSLYIETIDLFKHDTDKYLQSKDIADVISKSWFRPAIDKIELPYLLQSLFKSKYGYKSTVNNVVIPFKV